MSAYPRVLYQPPAGRPRWTNDKDPSGELQYLSWGWRSYGRHPIPVSLHAGWTYQLMITGRAVLNTGTAARTLRSGSLVIIGPSCPNGWNGTSRNERCRILNWIWRDAPLFESLCPAADGFKVLQTPAEMVRRLEDLHEETRNETRFSDEAAALSLHALRIRLDALLCRMLDGPGRAASPEKKVKHALAWLEEHPEELRPVSALSDYLQVSPATLNRLFQGKLKRSVRDVAYALRMKTAKKMLATSSLPVKEVAFRLGYNHPNDFTRAYARFWKQTPTGKLD